MTKMVESNDPRREELRKDLVTKQVFYYVDDEKGIDQKSREVFKRKKQIIHYPIGYDGGPKYDKVKRFIFTGFRNNSSLPVGIQKSAKRGYGFTKVLAPFMAVLESKTSIREICVEKTGTTKISPNTLTLSESTLQRLHPVFQNILDAQKQDRLDLANDKLHQLFPRKFKKTKKSYVPNSVNSALDSWTQSIDDFSDADKDAIRDLFDKLAITDDFWTTESLLATKGTLDQQYIEDVIDDYAGLMKQKHETPKLESKWQEFLERHNWVFSYLFAHPILLFRDEAYVGGTTLSNKNGKVTDYLLRNSLTDNVAFLEIKTHQTKLVSGKVAYRGDDVFRVSGDITGSVSQVLNQRDNFQKEYYSLKGKSDESFETLNSKCVVLIGMIKNLTKKQARSFELFRSNSKDVDIVTFDELLARFENLQSLITSDV
jgi:hypothetical protein